MSSDNTTITLGGLEAGELYEVQVKTLTSKGDSPFSISLMANTKEITITQTQKMKQALGIYNLENKIVSIM